jgi:peptidoglycan/LPS O-acetylase OafA/YrhL
MVELGARSSADVGATRASRARSPYRPELDGLRFFAFGAVLLHHALPQRSWNTLARFSPSLGEWAGAFATAMEFGVTLFFALSAYLITTLLVRECAEYGTLDIGAFYVRRSLRIWPLYFAFLAFTLFVLPPILKAPVLETRYQPFFWLFGANWACVLFDYPNSPDGVLWSVSSEEQFYLLWPLLLRFLPGLPLKHVAVAMLVLSNVARIALAFMQAPEHAVWFNPIAQLDPIAGGILLASLNTNSSSKRPAMNLWPCALGGVVVLVAMQRYLPDNSFRPLFLYPVASLVALVTLAAAIGRPPRVLLHRAIVYLGKISYGLYVFHALSLYLVGRVIPTTSNAVFVLLRLVLALPLTVVAAALSYRYLEHPFLRLKEHFARVTSRAPERSASPVPGSLSP